MNVNAIFESKNLEIKNVENFSWEELENEQKKLNKRGIKKLSDNDLYSYTFLKKNFLIFKNFDFKNLILEGKIIGINNNIVILDIGYREEAFLDLLKEDKSYFDDIYIENKIPVKILHRNNGYIFASYTEAKKYLKFKEIYNSIGKNVVYYGKVEKLIEGGYIVVIDGVETFMPGSLAGLNKLYNFEILKDKVLPVMAINYEKNSIIVSHRAYLHTLIPGKIEELKKELKINPNKKYKGFVTGTINYGVFCEFEECLTGLILNTNLDASTKEKFDAGLIKPGDDIEFYVRKIISPTKIALSQI